MQSFYLLLIVSFLSFNLSASESFRFTLLHTNDLHSHFEGNGPDSLFSKEVGDKDPVRGHHARLAYQIKQIKSEANHKDRPVLLVDAGDFFSGSLFHILAPHPDINAIPEFEFFHQMGYDMVTLGNHEFDAYDDGFLNMLRKIKKNNLNVPIVSTNLWFHNKNSSLYEFFGPNKLIQKSHVKIYKNGNKKIKIGYIGLLGPDGSIVSLSRRGSFSFYGYDDNKAKKDWDSLYKSLQSEVDVLKKEKKVDVVIAVMHGGTPEDNKIAENVSGIDILIAGHTHEAYPFPRNINGTIISQAGCYGQYLGKMEFSFEKGEIKLLSKPGQTLIPIDDRTPVDPSYMKIINTYKEKINSIMKRTGYKYDSPVFVANREIYRGRKLHDELGTLVTSAVKNELNKYTKKPIDFYFTSLALIRNNIIMPGGKDTPYQFSDIFNMMPIGFDKEFYPGAPIVTFYLNKEEVKDLILFLELYSKMTPSFTPAVSKSLNFEIRNLGIPFINRVKSLKLNGLPYDKWPELIHVGTSRIVAGYFDKVKKLSYGLVEFIPKNEDGSPMKKVIPNTELPREYKLLADYLKQFATQIPLR